MATTTFNGTVRSDGDIKATTKNTTTGAFVDYAVIKAAGGMEVEKVASTGNNIVAAGTSTGTNNASLGTAATIFKVTPNDHGTGIADDAICEITRPCWISSGLGTLVPRPVPVSG